MCVSIYKVRLVANNKMTSLEQTRQDILDETDRIASRSRFGLFSHAPSTAVGDNSPGVVKLRSFCFKLILKIRMAGQ